MRAGQKGRRKNPTRSEGGGGGGGETVEKRARGRGRVRKEWREGKKEKGGEKYEKKKKRGEARDIMRATRLVPASFTVLYQLRVNDIQRLIPRPNPLRLYASPRLASRHACVSKQLPVGLSLATFALSVFIFYFFLFIGDNNSSNKSSIEFSSFSFFLSIILHELFLFLSFYEYSFVISFFFQIARRIRYLFVLSRIFFFEKMLYIRCLGIF